MEQDIKSTFQVTVNGETKEYDSDTTYYQIAQEYQSDFEHDIVLVIMNGRLRELHKKIEESCKLEFVTTADTVGNQAYRRSTCLLMLKSIYDVIGREHLKKVRIHYSVSSGYYCTLQGDVVVSQELLDRIEARMRDQVAAKRMIQKRSVNTDEAIELFRNYGMHDKEKLFHYRCVSKVNLYRLGSFEDYFYGFMVKDTSYLKWFKLYLYDEGFVLQMPEKKNPEQVPEFEPEHKVFQVLKESVHWGDMLGVDTVGALNEKITKGEIQDLILIQEALQEKKMGHIAEMIASKPEKKLVMIAGPSSSGKTTFSHRLSIQLSALGMKPHPIAVDDYFLNRDLTPRDEFGKLDFECLEAIDIKQFNEDMNRLLEGEEVELPSYNFKTGKREYKGNVKKLGKDDILVIEGIHGLNEKLSYSLPEENKFRIYISALTQLNIDEHNRIPSTDGRLIRRIVRDARTRGTSAQKTISMWDSVRRGEERNIFPYQERADVMFNSALIYELAVLKLYAEPVLYGIRKDEPEYLEAKRLLKFLDYFVGVRSEDIPMNSILREFVGGSCFQV